MNAMALPRLALDQDRRVIAGVCAGIAQALVSSPRVVRLFAVLSIILPGPQFLAYVLLWILMPEE